METGRRAMDSQTADLMRGRKGQSTPIFFHLSSCSSSSIYPSHLLFSLLFFIIPATGLIASSQFLLVCRWSSRSPERSDKARKHRGGKWLNYSQCLRQRDETPRLTSETRPSSSSSLFFFSSIFFIWLHVSFLLGSYSFWEYLKVLGRVPNHTLYVCT